MRWQVCGGSCHGGNHLRQWPSPHAAALSPGKEIRARNGEGTNVSTRQARIDLSPACAVVGRKKDAAMSSGKEIRARNGEGTNISIRQAGIDLSPAFAVVGG